MLKWMLLQNILQAYKTKKKAIVIVNNSSSKKGGFMSPFFMGAAKGTNMFKLQSKILILILILASNTLFADELKGENFVLNCSECHGYDGNSKDVNIPNIAGLSKNYIIKQLRDFQSGRRKSKEMSDVVQAFPSEAAMIALAGYFSEQAMTSLNKAEDYSNNKQVNLVLGKEIFDGKRMEYGIPACKACHGADGMGTKEGRYPRLQGQHREYIVQQMQLFHTKKRSNDNPSMMRNIAMIMDSEDIESVAAYISTIK